MNYSTTNNNLYNTFWKLKNVRLPLRMDAESIPESKEYKNEKLN